MRKVLFTASVLTAGLAFASAHAAENYGPYPITLKGYSGSKTNSVAYTGQMARHVLHNSLKKLAGKGNGSPNAELKAQMMAYYRKALDIGFTGVYHECARNDIVPASLSHNSALRAVSFVDLRPRIPTANGTESAACLTQRRRRCFTSSGRSA